MAPVSRVSAISPCGKEDDLGRAADIVVGNPYWNPREAGAAQRRDIRQLLQSAFEGIRPKSA
jgi:hypothetical protein